MSDKWTPVVNALTDGPDGSTLQDLSLDTLAISSKPVRETVQKCQPLILPIHHSATYTIEKVQDFETIMQEGGGHIYSRLGNPSCQATECAINALEGGAGSLVFSSGMAAIVSSITAFVRPGDHVVACRTVYSGTHKYLLKYLTRLNVNISWVSPDGGIEAYRRAAGPKTKILYTETPVNPTISVMDLEALGQLRLTLPEGAIAVVDATYGSPYLQQPLKYDGIDISVHSASKYLNGHGDLVAGVATTKTVQHWTELMLYRTIVGNVLSPGDATQVLRGIKTLHLRMERHSSNAQALAEYLAKHPKISAVHYPGLPTHPEYKVARKQMKAGGGMIAFEVKGNVEVAKRFVESLRLVRLAVSLGSTESLVCHPASMTHGEWIMTAEDRKAAGISDGYMRFSVGLEGVDDLRRDLEQALAKA